MIRGTLVTDGSSDRVLLRVVEWVLREAGVSADLILQWADLRGLRTRPEGLTAKIKAAVALYDCELLFVHRDAETASRSERLDEIRLAIGQSVLPYVALIPVRMQESWLLCDEQAIRTASGNPNGSARLEMPNEAAIERIADPKAVVFELLRVASERKGRKLGQFNVEFARNLICEQIRDFSVLRSLSSFRAFEEDLNSVVVNCHFDRYR